MRQVSRRLQSLNNRVFHRVTQEELREGLVRLGLAKGETVYARVSMRSLGFVTGGPAALIEAILDVVGPDGTLVTTAWPFPDAARVDPSLLFNLRETPSRAGLLSETLRLHPGACRSLHPIASMVAVGARAADLMAGHERSERPFGPDSPYERLRLTGPRLLLVGTHMGGILHHIQDRVGFPNLYQSAAIDFETVDGQGRRHLVRTTPVRAGIPPVVILPGSRPENRDYLLIQDYALIYPSHREREVMESGYLRFNRSRFLGRRDRLQARGILKAGQLGSAEAALLDGARMLDQVEKDLAWDLARHKEEYDPEHLSNLSLPLF